jgi:DNA replication and repair protein RecF
MAQRNRLLKSPEVDHDQLFVWDVGMSELATKIVAARMSYIDNWNQTLTKHYQEISHSSDTISVAYSDTTPIERYTQTLLTKLRDSFERDRMIGSTSHGPHRDDYTFYIESNNMAHTASRGEIRTLLLALKYHEAEQLRAIHDTPALFLFDDVFSELDESRQANVLDKHAEHQIVITTTHVNAKQRKKYTIIELS